jgi:hypothetical protein
MHPGWDPVTAVVTDLLLVGTTGRVVGGLKERVWWALAEGRHRHYTVARLHALCAF